MGASSYCMRLVRPAPSVLLLLLASCASQPVQTARQTTQDNIGGAVTAPLSDLNLIRSKIPLALREAITEGRFEAFRREFHGFQDGE